MMKRGFNSIYLMLFSIMFIILISGFVGAACTGTLRCYYLSSDQNMCEFYERYPQICSWVDTTHTCTNYVSSCSAITNEALCNSDINCAWTDEPTCVDSDRGSSPYSTVVNKDVGGRVTILGAIKGSDRCLSANSPTNGQCGVMEYYCMNENQYSAANVACGPGRGCTCNTVGCYCYTVNLALSTFCGDKTFSIDCGPPSSQTVSYTATGTLPCNAPNTCTNNICVPPAAVCGNGKRETGEQCDDGDTSSGDGCSSTCKLETGWTCNTATPNVCTPICGDGRVISPEQCDGSNLNGKTCVTQGYDDGTLSCTMSGLNQCKFNTASCCDDACSSGATRCSGSLIQTCVTNGDSDPCYEWGTAVSCPSGQICSGGRCVNACGDGIVQTSLGEQCDYGNSNGQLCVPSYGSSCTYCSSSCKLITLTGPYCGDGTCGSGETCLTCSRDCGGCPSVQVCGNGVKEGTEQCDDGDRSSGDGCSSTCTVETGWTCNTATPNVCTPICGDGLIKGTEACDGSNLGGKTCISLGYTGGTLSCSLCSFNIGSCTSACDLYSAHWSTTSAFSGSSVNLYVEGNSGCNGKTITFQIRRVQTIGTEFVANAASDVFSGGASSTWVTIAPYSGDSTPTYLFRASDGSDTAESNRLDVTSSVTCPNGNCGSGETCANCPDDCGACCGDGTCNYGETYSTCPADCDNPSPPANCEITSASWNQTTALEGSPVKLNIQGTDCDGETISFVILEKDGGLDGDDNLADLGGTDPVDIVYSSSVKSGTWIAEWHDDTGGLLSSQTNPPEYYFKVIVNDEENAKSSEEDANMLKVYQRDTACAGVNYCLNYITEIECESDICGVGEASVPGDISCGSVYNPITECYDNTNCGCSWDEVTETCDMSIKFESICGIDEGACVPYEDICWLQGDKCTDECICEEGYLPNYDGTCGDTNPDVCVEDFSTNDCWLMGDKCQYDCTCEEGYLPNGEGICIGEGGVGTILREIGECFYTEVGEDDCSDNFLIRSLNAFWQWDTANSYTEIPDGENGINYVEDIEYGVYRYDPNGESLRCVNIEDTFICPASVEVPFFGVYQLVIVIAIIGLIYLIYALRKKSSSKSKHSKIKRKKRTHKK